MRYVHHTVPSAYNATLGTLPYCLAWQRQSRGVDKLCCGRDPLVLSMPALIDYISVTKERDGRYCLQLKLLPLVLQDVIGLYILVNFVRSRNGSLPHLYTTA